MTSYKRPHSSSSIHAALSNDVGYKRIKSEIGSPLSSPANSHDPQYTQYLESKLGEFMHDLDRAKATIRDKEALVAEMEVFLEAGNGHTESKLKQCEIEKEQLESALKKSLNEKMCLTSKINKLTRDEQKLSCTNRDLQLSLASYKRQNSLRKSQQQDLESSHAAQTSRLKQSLESSNAILSMISNAWSVALEEIPTALQLREEEHQLTLTKLATARKSVSSLRNDLQQQIAQSHSETDKMTQCLLEVQAERDYFALRYQDQHNTIESKQNALQVKEEEFNSLQQSHIALQHQFDAESQSNDDVLAGWKQEAAKLQKALQVATTNFQQSELECANLRGRVAETHRALEVQQEQAQRTSDQVSSLQASLQTSQGRVDKYRKRVTMLSDGIRRLLQAVDSDDELEIL